SSDERLPLVEAAGPAGAVRREVLRAGAGDRSDEGPRVLLVVLRCAVPGLPGRTRDPRALEATARRSGRRVADTRADAAGSERRPRARNRVPGVRGKLISRERAHPTGLLSGARSCV